MHKKYLSGSPGGRALHQRSRGRAFTVLLFLFALSLAQYVCVCVWRMSHTRVQREKVHWILKIRQQLLKGTKLKDSRLDVSCSYTVRATWFGIVRVLLCLVWEIMHMQQQHTPPLFLFQVRPSSHCCSYRLKVRQWSIRPLAPPFRLVQNEIYNSFMSPLLSRWVVGVVVVHIFEQWSTRFDYTTATWMRPCKGEPMPLRKREREDKFLSNRLVSLDDFLFRTPGDATDEELPAVVDAMLPSYFRARVLSICLSCVCAHMQAGG